MNHIVYRALVQRLRDIFPAENKLGVILIPENAVVEEEFQNKENILMESSAFLLERRKATNSTWAERATFDIDTRILYGCGAFDLRKAISMVSDAFRHDATNPMLIYHNADNSVGYRVSDEYYPKNLGNNGDTVFAPDDVNNPFTTLQIVNAFNQPNLPIDDWYVATTSFECSYILPST